MDSSVNWISAEAFSEEALCATLRSESLFVGDGFLSHEEVDALRAEIQALDQSGLLQPAAVGRAAGRFVDPQVRGDRTLWLPTPSAPMGSKVLERIEALRQGLNREFFLGLWDFEGHYALYPPGGRYERHLDRFDSSQRREVSLIVYLNPSDWSAEADGGGLRAFIPALSGEVEQERVVAPVGGRMVCFFSAEIPHEVLPAKRDRMSLTGWFRVR